MSMHSGPRGKFVIVDGIAGSGKTTIIQAMHDVLLAQGLNCFRMQTWQGDHQPTLAELPKDIDVLFTCEPTRTWIGAAIRHEMSQTEQPYGGEELAHAFSLDRQIAYRRLILPALTAGKIVIQDRGVTTSLIYQPIMKTNPVPLEMVKNLPGNKLALEHAPDHLILTSLPVDTIVERIRSRKEESKGVFADVELLRKADRCFREPWFRELMESRGTKIHTLDTGGTLEQSKANAVALITELLQKT